MVKRFRGGTHPPDKKALSESKAVQPLPMPTELVVPMSQHIGALAKPLVKPKDTVLKGQLIGEAAGFVSTNIHSPTSGTVKKVEARPFPMGPSMPAVVIEPDGNDTWAEGLDQPRDASTMSADDIKTAVLEMGVVGMGGATFPTHVKISPPREKPIDSLLINGVECEPYLTSDHRLMLEQPGAIVEGIELLAKLLGVKRTIIGIEANKPDAAEAMRRAVEGRGDVSVDVLPVMYPQGAEKQLIKACLGREVPSGGLPMDVGVVVQNVGTCVAVADAVLRRRPLIERVVTVSGEAAERPGNFLVRLGTPVQALIDAVGTRPGFRRLISGGPMMGFAQETPEIPVTKGTSGILLLEGEPVDGHRACIRCGRCLACPMGLTPSVLSVQLEDRRVEDAMATNMADCIECGVCTYVCPSKRPIVQWIKYGKLEARKKT